jgi:hypothetical protein
MSSQTFEILCPICRSVVPPEARNCPTCEQAKIAAANGTAATATATAGPVAQTANTRTPPPDLRALPMRDYHRVVRATYQATERTAGGNRVRAYLPFVVLLLLLIVGAAMLYSQI